MSFLEMFTVVASSATIFAFIVGVFSVYNGRMTRKEISSLIVSASDETRKILVEHGKILDKITVMLEKIYDKGSENKQKGR